MQNRYVGDVADFAKYGLLRFLSKSRLRLGLVWYLHHDQRHGADAKKLNYDGKYTSYLVRTPDDDRREFRDCDPDLWDKLRDLILRDARCVHCVEEAGILPEDTLYYDAQLHYVPGGSSKAVRAAKVTMREYWFHGALRVTERAGLVCVDPDNGIASDEKMHLKDGPKHVYLPDLKAFWERGQSSRDLSPLGTSGGRTGPSGDGLQPAQIWTGRGPNPFRSCGTVERLGYSSSYQGQSMRSSSRSA